MCNGLIFRALAFCVGLAVRLVHLPTFYLWCALGANIGDIPAVNAVLVLPLGIAVMQLWRGWQNLRHSSDTESVPDEQWEELNWLLDHLDLPGFKKRAWHYFCTQKEIRNLFLEDIYSSMANWGAGCFIVGWLWSFIDKFSSEPMEGFSLDFFTHWAHAGDRILEHLWPVLIFLPCQFVLFALYLFILMRADLRTLDLLTHIERAKR